MYDCMRIIECTYQMFACNANTHIPTHTHTKLVQESTGLRQTIPQITICYGYNV